MKSSVMKHLPDKGDILYDYDGSKYQVTLTRYDEHTCYCVRLQRIEDDPLGIKNPRIMERRVFKLLDEGYFLEPETTYKDICNAIDKSSNKVVDGLENAIPAMIAFVDKIDELDKDLHNEKE